MSVRQRERGFGFTLVAWRWCFRQSKPPFRESLLEHTDGSGLMWLSQHSQSERSLIIQPYRQVDRLEVTESWYRRMISDAVSLGNFKRVSGAGVTKKGLLGYQCSHGYKLLGTRGPHLLFLGEKVCVIMNNNAVLSLELIQAIIAWIAAVFLYFFFCLLHFWELLKWIKTEMQWTTNISRYVCERVVKRC